MSKRRLVCLSELTRGTLPIKCIPIMHKVRAWSFFFIQLALIRIFQDYLIGRRPFTPLLPLKQPWNTRVNKSPEWNVSNNTFLTTKQRGYIFGIIVIPTWISNYIHYKVWVKLLIHSQTPTVQPLKFGNGLVISSHTFSDMWLLIQAEIKAKTC